MKESKDVIIRNRRDPKGFIMFLNELQEAFNGGWKVPAIEEMTIQDTPGFLNHYAVKVYKEVEEITVDLLSNKSATKPQLLKLADKLEVEVPEDKKTPAAISKFLRETLAAKEEE